MLKKIRILLGLAAAAAGLFAFIVFLLPSEFRVTRSATIAAPADVVFAQVNNFRNWEFWSPWADRDPDAVFGYGGPSSGVGASFEWTGNNEIGQGSQKIVESVGNERIAIELRFTKPFQAENLVEFAFKPDNDGTTVTWSMSGNRDFMSRMFSLLMNADGMIGRDFEQGLSNLKKVSEAAAKN